jgi:hypothetical protein
VCTALVTQFPILTRASHPSVDLCHLCAIQQIAAVKQWRYRRRSRAVVTAVVTGIDLCAATVCIARVGALEAVVAVAIELACDSLTRTLAEAFALTTVGTGQVFDPIVACGLVGAYLNIIACTSVGIWIALVTEGRRVAAARVILHTAHTTGRRRTPSPFL